MLELCSVHWYMVYGSVEHLFWLSINYKHFLFIYIFYYSICHHYYFLLWMYLHVYLLLKLNCYFSNYFFQICLMSSVCISDYMLLITYVYSDCQHQRGKRSWYRAPGNWCQMYRPSIWKNKSRAATHQHHYPSFISSTKALRWSAIKESILFYLLYLFAVEKLITESSETKSLAVTERPCDSCMGQFWPNITGRRYFADIMGRSSSTVT